MGWKAVVGAAMLVMTLEGTALAADIGSDSVAVVVRVFDNFGVSERDMAVALHEAARILDGVALRLFWVTCAGREGAPAGCGGPLGPSELMVRLGGASQPSGGASVIMGYAFVNPAARYSLLANVFVDLVRSTSRHARVDPRVLLGRAIAHEIGHLLINTNSHADAGLMRAVWSTAEMRHDAAADWRFGEDEGRLMRNALMASAR